MNEPSEDADLVARARTGDREAFACLFARHVALARRVTARSVLPGDGLNDVIQDAAVQAWLNLDSLRDASRFGAWLAGIALNIARHAVRRAAAAPLSWEALFGGRLVLSDPPDPEPAPEEIAEAQEFSACVRAAVAELPRGQREAVLLFYLDGLSYRETAAVLQINPSAVKSRLHKGRAQLQKRLHDLWEENLMTTSTEQQMIEMRVTDVRRGVPREGERDRTVIHLTEVDGARRLPIWVGHWEGDSIAMLVEKVKTPRPLTHAFTASLLRAGGVTVQQVQIHRLAEETFYASVVLESPSGEAKTVDARPSDCVALALELDVPIYVAADVLSAVEAAHTEPPELSNGAKEIVTELIENWQSQGKPSR